MTFSTVFVVVSLVALTLLLLAVRQRRTLLTNSNRVVEQLQSVDIESFRNLIDPAEEQFLREQLNRRQFRIVRRARLLATTDYVRRASHNAAILLRLGEAARHNSDPRIADAGQRLVDDAIRLRVFALFSMTQLYLGVALPGVRISAGSLVESYQQLSGLASQVMVMQRPQPSAPLIAAV